MIFSQPHVSPQNKFENDCASMIWKVDLLLLTCLIDSIFFTKSLGCHRSARKASSQRFVRHVGKVLEQPVQIPRPLPQQTFSRSDGGDDEAKLYRQKNV
jgi:hypothetical protein